MRTGRLAGVADYSLKKLNALLDDAGVDRTRLMRKEQLVDKVRPTGQPVRPRPGPPQSVLRSADPSLLPCLPALPCRRARY